MQAEQTTENLIETNKALHAENNYLKQQLQWFHRQLFGKKSEKVIDQTNALQLSFLDEEQTTIQEEQVVKSYTKKKANRNGQDAISFPEDLPVERQVLDIPEEKKEGLVKIGEEITQKLAYRQEVTLLKRLCRSQK